MPIPVTCSCGKDLTIKDEFGGKIVECPACHEPIPVPNVALQQRFVEAQELIQSRDPEERLRAIEIFCEVKDPYGWPPVLDCVFGQNREVAERALMALLDHQPETRRQVDHWLSHAPDVTNSLMQLFRQYHHEASIDLLLKLLDERRLEEAEVASAIDFLGWCYRPRAVDTLDRLRPEFPHLEQIIKSAICRLEDPESGIKKLYGKREQQAVSGGGAFSLNSCLTTWLALVSGAALVSWLLTR